MTEENKPKPYVTIRTMLWRSRELKPFFLESIDTIEEYGCRIIYVATEDRNDSWSYTTGVYETSGKPEIITVGLRMETAKAALNEAVRRMRRGVDLTQGRHNNIIGAVDAEFRAINPRWLHHLMLHTNWFYEGRDVPVLQLIFPDLQNRFPGEPNFDERFIQPVLSGEIKPGSLEYEFWKAQGAPGSDPPLLN
jgi:hypothetical protein